MNGLRLRRKTHGLQHDLKAVQMSASVRKYSGGYISQGTCSDSGESIDNMIQGIASSGFFHLYAKRTARNSMRCCKGLCV